MKSREESMLETVLGGPRQMTEIGAGVGREDGQSSAPAESGGALEVRDVKNLKVTI